MPHFTDNKETKTKNDRNKREERRGTFRNDEGNL